MADATHQSLPGPALKEAVRARALELGFEAFGVAPVAAPLRRDYFLQWIAEGKHGTMEWMAKNTARRLDPAKILPEAKSILCFGLNYYQPEPVGRRGRISRYALGDDYHNLMIKRLQKLCTFLRAHGGANKPYVDTGPVLEKPLAAAAGLGWQAKNTITIHPQFGNWLFLGEILTTLELPPDEAVPDRCGTCTRCMSACPTNAITAPYQLDASRCIAYLTIEHDGPIPEEFREAIGDRLFGCEECLEVCPWNRWAQFTRESRFAPRPLPDPRDMLAWDEATFREHFRGSPIRRTGLARWKRNLCIVLGNTGTAEDLPALRTAAASADALVAEHAAWALRRLESRLAEARD